MNFNRQVTKPPEKGSFPLDHFHECSTQAKQYSYCMEKHLNLVKKCRKFQKDYLKCRMELNLMQKTDMKTLGMTQENSWESEEQERKAVLERIKDSKQRAYQRVMEKERLKREQERIANPESKGQNI